MIIHARCLPGLILAFLPMFVASNAWAEESIRLSEGFPPGYQYHVSCRVELSGSLTLPPEKGQSEAKSLGITGSSAIEYDERVLSRSADAQVDKTARIYRRIDFQRTVGGRPQENTIRPQVRRLVVLRRKNVEVPFSPDGPLLWGEIDLVRTDVFTPALVGLLPQGPVTLKSRWTASTAAIQELTDMVSIDEGSVRCTFTERASLGDRPHVRISFTGTVRGTNEDGPNRQHLEGYLFFDLESRHISYLYLKGTQSLLDADGKVQGKIVGRFTLTRQVSQGPRDLSDQALRGVVLEPTADNTLLLYDNADLGIQFLYPRRWHVAGVRGRQVALDEVKGNGLLLTLEPARQVPSAAQFLAESRTWLGQQKARLLRVEQPRRLQGSPAVVDHFALDAEVMGQRVLMDYYVLRQARGGATLAARLLPADQAALRKEVERIARSLRITSTIDPGPRK
jgi:hypothetical protein